LILVWAKIWDMQTKTKIFANSFSTIELYHVKKKTIAKKASSNFKQKTMPYSNQEF
jgi:hypothetical protein